MLDRILAICHWPCGKNGCSYIKTKKNKLEMVMPLCVYVFTHRCTHRICILKSTEGVKMLRRQ